MAIDPGSLHNQTEGGAIFGLSNLLHGGVTVVGGGTAQANLDTTKYFRMPDAPEIEVILIPTDNPPGAAGELGTIVVYGAVGNAVSRASGVKQFHYPFEEVDLIPSPNP